MQFTMICDDKVWGEYIKFRNSEDYNKNIVRRLLHYYKPFLMPTKKQLKLLKKEEQGKYAKNGCTFYDTYEEGLSKTLLKIILTTDENAKFPYIDINNSRLENNLTATYYNNEKDRKYAKEHILSLLHNSKKLIIRDAYFVLQNVYDAFNSFFTDLYKINTSIEIHIDCRPKSYDNNEQQYFVIDDRLKDLRQKWKQWKFHKVINKTDKNSSNSSNGDDKYAFSHDRYFLIDDEIELILTSGIDHLYGKNIKDFTYIVRVVK